MIIRGGRKSLVARFGDIWLVRQHHAILNDQAPILATNRGNELIHRLLANGCEMCGAHMNVEVHHVRHLGSRNEISYPFGDIIEPVTCDDANFGGFVVPFRLLADLNKPGRREKPAWVKLMAMRRRKTLVVCRPCHEAIHAGRPAATSTA